MSSELLAEQILYACGFGPTLLLGFEDEGLLGEFTNRGVECWVVEGAEEKTANVNYRLPGRYLSTNFLDFEPDFEVVNVVWQLDFSKIGRDKISAYLDRLKEQSNRFVYLITTNFGNGTPGFETWREAVDFSHNSFLEAGFRKSALYQRVSPFSQNRNENHEVVVFERIPQAGLEYVSLAELYAERRRPLGSSSDLDSGMTIRERDLHMDMLREIGIRSDAHVARYDFSLGFIRPNDLVLEAGSGLGYGSEIVFQGSYCSKVVGIDNSSFAVEYATKNYGIDGKVEFVQRSLANRLPFNAAQVDVCCAFEIIEHLADPSIFLKDLKRVLKPGGRVILSVPNMWVDETGKDPWIFHEDFYDLSKVTKLVETEFLLDKVYCQSAGGKGRRFADRRILTEWHDGAAGSLTESEVEWWIISAVKSPLKPGRAKYEESVLVQSNRKIHNSHSFSRDYENPWILHSLIHGSLRVRSQALLNEVAESVLKNSGENSPDRGGALCVQVYQRMGASTDDKKNLCDEIDNYLSHPSKNPHFLRWEISLLYARALLYQTSGDFENAIQQYEKCAALDALKFSPHLCTKTTEAAYLAGVLLLSKGKVNRAGRAWKRGMVIGAQLLKSTWSDIVVNEKTPNRFGLGDGLRETIVSIDNVNRCANGLYFLRFGFGRTGLLLGVEDSFKKIEKRDQINQISLAIEGQAKERNYHWALNAERKKNELESKTNALTTNLEKLQRKVEQLQEQNESLNEQNAKVELLVDQKTKEGDAFRKNLEELSDVLSSKIDELSERESLLAELTSKNESLSERLKDTLSEKIDIQKESDRFFEEMQTLDSDLQELRRQFDRELELKEGQIADFKLKFETELQFREKTEVALSQRESEIETLKGRLDRKIDQLENTRNELEVTVHDYEERVSNLISDFRGKELGYKAEIKSLGAEMARLTADWTEKKTSFEDRLHYYDTQLRLSRRNLDDKDEQLKQARERNDKLSADNNELSGSLMTTEASLIDQEKRTQEEVIRVGCLKEEILDCYIKESDDAFNSGLLEEKARLKWRGTGFRARLINVGSRGVRALRLIYCFIRRKSQESNAAVRSVVQLNTHDIVGGAERCSYDLHVEFRDRKDIEGTLLVGGKYSDDIDVIKLEYAQRDWKLAETWRDNWGFTEAFYPSPITWTIKLKELRKADIVHIHNMHGKYWSSLTLVPFAFQHPTVLTLHDEYTITGDCCYTYECDRWKNSCGKCPQIGLPVNQKYSLGGKDKTRFNVLLKRLLFNLPRAYPMVVVTPSKWLSDRAKRSKNLRHLPIVTIPYGIDLDLWSPRDQDKCRVEENFPRDKIIALVVANDLSDRRKGFSAVLDAIKKLPEGHNLFFVVVGGIPKEVHDSTLELPIHATGFVKDKDRMVNLYGVADFIVALSRVDNLPYMCLESLACGRPILGSDAGGIPEIVCDEQLGWLEPSVLDPESIKNRLLEVARTLSDKETKQTMFERCRYSALARYSGEKMINRYVNLYDQIGTHSGPGNGIDITKLNGNGEEF